MRKAFFTVLFLFIEFSMIFADTAKPRLLFGSGNDKFTYGLSKNEDDQLSYSGIIEFDYENNKLRLNMEAFTDRGSRPNGVYRTGRLDVISLDYGKYYKFKAGEDLSFNLSGTVGVGMTGKLYFDAVQNFHHKNVGVAEAEIPYDWEAVKISPMAGIGLGVDYGFKYVKLGVNTNYRYLYKFVAERNVSIGASAFDNTFSLQLGYQANGNFSKSQTVDATLDATNGPFIAIGVDASPFIMKWSFYPKSSFGYGTFFIDALPFLRGETTWKESDIYFVYDTSSFYDMELLNAGIGIPITDTITSSFEVRYVSGFPVSDSSTRIQRNYALYEVGASFTPVKGFISPYLEGQLGLGVFQINYLKNTDPESVGEDDRFPARAVFIADLCFGVKVFPEGFLAFGNNSYQLQMYCGTHIMPWNKYFTSAIENDNAHSSSWVASVLGPYMGIGVSIGIDVSE